jgi:hypothetical protein
MRKSIAVLAAGAMALAPATAFGAPTSTPPSSGDISPTATTGQPNQDCESLGNQPGSSLSASGSAFNFVDGQAGTVYAGEQTNINDKNTAAASQYDVACLKQTNRVNR